jgi:DNA processing protein
MPPRAKRVPLREREDVLERRLRFARATTPKEAAAYVRLLSETGGPEAALALPPDGAARIAGEAPDFVARLLAPHGQADLKRRAERLERFGARLVLLTDDDYPALLRQIPDPPAALHVRGLPFPERPAVALVGARRASRAGLEAARLIARDLARAGVAVVSGFARGVDAAAHKGAIEEGTTVAVFGCGADVCYPAEGRALLTELLAKGTALSELPMGTEPRPSFFPWRNRIIAGLSRVVVVVEAAERSGSLITARLAAEYGRDVGAVPGGIVSGSAAGSNALLKDGAFLVRDAGDVLRELPEEDKETLAPAPPRPKRRLPEDAELLLEALSPEEPRDADALAASTRLPAARLGSALAALELEGLVEALPGALFLRRGA